MNARDRLLYALLAAGRRRRKGARLIRTAWLPRDTYRLLKSELRMGNAGLTVICPWGPVAIREMDRHDGNSRYL